MSIYTLYADTVGLKNMNDTLGHLHNSRAAPACRISMRVGIAFYDPGSLCSVNELSAKANSVMYESKKLKKN